MTSFFSMAVFVFGALGAGAAVETAVSQTPTRSVFLMRSDLVVLHALVKDRDGNHVSGLAADAFAVWEEDQPQTIQFFAREDAPVTIGLIVDTSGSIGVVR